MNTIDVQVGYSWVGTGFHRLGIENTRLFSLLICVTRGRRAVGEFVTVTVVTASSMSSDNLEERYRDFHFKGKTTKEWSKRECEAKIEEIEENLEALISSDLS